MSLITQESPYLKCCDVSNVNVWAMSENGFKWTEDISVFYEFFIKSYNEKSKDGYFLEVDIQYPENLRNTQNNLPFFSESRKIEKVEKLVVNLYHKNEYE